MTEIGLLMLGSGVIWAAKDDSSSAANRMKPGHWLAVAGLFLACWSARSTLEDDCRGGDDVACYELELQDYPAR